MAVVSTACTYDCPDACALRVEVEGNHITIRGDPDHPITRGFVCPRVRRHVRRLSDPKRITAPQRRSKAGFVEMAWGDALDLAAEKLDKAIGEYGPASVVPVSLGGSLGIKKELVGHFFRSLGPVTTLQGGVCDEAGKQAQVLDFGHRACHDYTDLENSRAVVLWGKNPVETSVHLVPFIQKARSRGAPVVLIEVMPTPTWAFADRVIRLAPSADGLLALAVLRWLHDRKQLDENAIHRCENYPDFERMLLSAGMEVETLARRAEVSESDVQYLAGLYAHSRPVATWVGFGLQRRVSGGRNLRCIDALGALSGNLGLPGGGVNFGPGRSRGLDRSILAPASGRRVAAPTFGRDLPALKDPPARFVYVQGANPVCQFADSRSVAAALRGVDFTVVADAFLTDTAACADLILPVTLMFEEEFDIIGSFGHHHVARVSRAVEPPPGVREDVWIVSQLNRRLGRPEDPWLADPKAAVEKMCFRWFGGSSERYRLNPAQDPVPFAQAFATPSGKMNLITELPGLAPALDGPRPYPLVFMTPKTRRYQQSQIRPEEQAGRPHCRVHPEAPGVRGMQDGARARVVGPLGSMDVIIRHESGLRRDVCVVVSGGWLQYGRGVNALVAAQATDLGDCTAFYDQRVRIEPCAPC
jgi:anaerobic selenocysteine-containing dehydrogenase